MSGGCPSSECVLSEVPLCIRNSVAYRGGGGGGGVGVPEHGHVNCQEFQLALQRQYRFWPLMADLCRSCPCFVAKMLKHALEVLQRVVRRIEERYFRVSGHRLIVFKVPRSF